MGGLVLQQVAVLGGLLCTDGIQDQSSGKMPRSLAPQDWSLLEAGDGKVRPEGVKRQYKGSIW